MLLCNKDNEHLIFEGGDKLNILQLEYFVEIVDCNCNISIAASNLHVSQSTLSRSIIRLEENENKQLFSRNGKRLIGLTLTGQQLYRDAKRVLSSYETLLKNLRHSPDGGGTVRIGLTPAILSAFFAESLPSFLLQNAKLNIEVVEAGGETLQQQLLLEKIDLAYLIAPIQYNSLQTESLISDTGVLVYNPKLFTDKPSLNQLNEIPLVLLNQKFTFRHQIDQWFLKSGNHPKIIMETENEETLLNATQNTPVATILPNPVLTGYRTIGLSTIPISDLSWELLFCQKTAHFNPLSKMVGDHFNPLIAKNDQMQDS